MSNVYGLPLKSQKLVPILLVTCIVIVTAWEVMSKRSRRPLAPFNLVSSDFAAFVPHAEGWTVEKIEAAADDPSAPNLLSCMVRRKDDRTARLGLPVLIRLVHGYNMPDCMRLKGYTVELIEDSGEDVSRGKTSPPVSALSAPAPLRAGSSLARQSPDAPAAVGTTAAVRTDFGLPRIQVWRLTSDIGDVSIACSAMIRATDFGGTGVDIRDMAFPRIAGRIGPEWDWVGFRLSSLRHPVQSLVMLCRVKWNNSRCDLLTFLKLRQPAWASNEYITFLATSRGVNVAAGDEEAVIGEIRAAQEAVYGELRRWGGEKRNTK